MQVKRLFVIITVLFSLLFPNFAHTQQRERPIVRLVYFLPRDRQPQPNINAKMDRLIKDVQQFYEKQMENRGFGRKTFQFETDAHGNAVVYHINGRFDDTYYHDVSDVAWKEINEQFDQSRDVYLTALDISAELIGTGENDPVCGIGWGSIHGGGALIPASGHCFNISTAAHELGHAFGLFHDFRNNTYLMAYGVQNTLSQCTAEWLDAHRAFNTSQITSDTLTTIEMLPPRLGSPPNAIHLRFKVTDPDGIHQVQLLTETLRGPVKGFPELIACKHLSRNPSLTVDFVTTFLSPGNKSVFLRVIDVHGNFTESQAFPIDITTLLPPPRVVSISDPNLAAAIQQEIGNSITTHTLLNLTRLDVPNRGIKNLTGLEHAHNLRKLNLGDEYVDGERDINSNAISDVSSLSGLTQLAELQLSDNSISDISPLAELKQLTYLNIGGNSISDISPLAELKQLTDVFLWSNSISDISPLAELKQLTVLNIRGNSISDISPLTELKQLTALEIGGNSISDISPLTELKQLTALEIGGSGISDISPLAELKQLTDVFLWNNSISDISPLAELKQLTALKIGSNSISDVSPIVGLNLTGKVWDSTGLDLRWNPLSYASVNIHIPAMQAKGIEVKFDNRTHPALLKISGEAQVGAAGTALPAPFVVEFRNERGKHRRGVSVTFAITAGGGQLSATTATTNAVGRARTTLTLGRTPGTNTVRATVNGIQSFVTFKAITGDPPLYWIDAANSTLHRRMGTTVVNLVPSVRSATSLALDLAGGKFYWTERINNRTGNIRCADLDGSNVQLMKALTSLPLGIAVDATNHKLYLTNAWGKVQRLSVDGSNFQPNLITDLEAPKDIAVDGANGKIYWTERTSSSTGRIQRADLDGSNVELVKALTSVPGGIAVDPANGKLYVTNTSGKIQRLNVDGSNFHPNLITGLDAPQDVAVDIAGGKLYWTEAGRILRADLNGENIEDVVTGLGTPASIVLSIVPAEPVIAAAPAVLTVLPEATGLLPNYPNPFNPETWIPYQLAVPSNVTLHIYSVKGALVRTLAVGHQPAGTYHSRSRAAYWNGRNEQGEKVASGIYFYTLSSGEFSTTRKLLIRK